MKQTLVIAPNYQCYKVWIQTQEDIAQRSLRREYRYISVDRDLWGWSGPSARLVILWYPEASIDASPAWKNLMEEVDRIRALRKMEIEHIRI